MSETYAAGYGCPPQKCNCCGQTAPLVSYGEADRGGHTWTHSVCEPCRAGCTSDEDGRPLHVGPDSQVLSDGTFAARSWAVLIDAPRMQTRVQEDDCLGALKGNWQMAASYEAACKVRDELLAEGWAEAPYDGDCRF